MKSMKLVLVSLCAIGVAAACSSSRELEITGEVSSAQAVAGPITLQFYEMEKDVEDAERVLVHEAELEALGSFTETVEVAEDIVIVLAIEDSDGDGKCTAGELWGETQQEVKEDDTVDPFQLALTAAPCPAE